MTAAPPRGPFAAVARKAVEDHDEWDSMHQFVTFGWDGGKLSAHTAVVIDPAIHPDDYPAMLRDQVARENAAHPGRPSYAFLLQIEAHGVTGPAGDATDAERAEFEAARRTRTFHRLPQAREICVAYLADVHGRLWTAGKERGREDRLEEHFYGVLAADRPGGQFIRALVSIGYAQGAAHFGLPVPGGLLT